MSKLTADTITDEQIRGLRDESAALPTARARRDRTEICDIALDRFALSSAKAKRSARARCAEILNARKGGSHV